MPRDPKKVKEKAEALAAAADADAARLAGSLWSQESVPSAVVVPAVLADSPADRATGLVQETLPKMMEAMTKDPDFLAHLLEVRSLVKGLVERESSPGVPAWITDMAGNPLTYDLPSKGRKDVCARITPSTYGRLKQAQTRLGLRTTAGAWEYVLRLGLAVVDRMPARRD